MSENKKTNQIQPPEEIVLCGASAYNQKFYINENFKNLPDEIKNQLKVMCVLFCADIGGILQLGLGEHVGVADLHGALRDLRDALTGTAALNGDLDGEELVSELCLLLDSLFAEGNQINF